MGHQGCGGSSSTGSDSFQEAETLKHALAGLSEDNIPHNLRFVEDFLNTCSGGSITLVGTRLFAQVVFEKWAIVHQATQPDHSKSIKGVHPRSCQDGGNFTGS